MRIWLLLLIVCFAARADAAEGQWQWVKATNVGGWEVSEGNADVSIQGEKFNARLFWKGSDKEVKILLRGVIKKGKITVTEEIQGSDYTGSTYEGTFQTKRWKEFSGTLGAESITLSDGWGMIGITRSIKK
jgi:outer membrane biogenesis lipoprotein LolB